MKIKCIITHPKGSTPTSIVASANAMSVKAFKGSCGHTFASNLDNPSCTECSETSVEELKNAGEIESLSQIEESTGNTATLHCHACSSVHWVNADTTAINCPECSEELRVVGSEDAEEDAEEDVEDAEEDVEVPDELEDDSEMGDDSEPEMGDDSEPEIEEEPELVVESGVGVVNASDNQMIAEGETSPELVKDLEDAVTSEEVLSVCRKHGLDLKVEASEDGDSYIAIDGDDGDGEPTLGLVVTSESVMDSEGATLATGEIEDPDALIAELDETDSLSGVIAVLASNNLSVTTTLIAMQDEPEADSEGDSQDDDSSDTVEVIDEEVIEAMDDDSEMDDEEDDSEPEVDEVDEVDEDDVTDLLDPEVDNLEVATIDLIPQDASLDIQHHGTVILVSAGNTVIAKATLDSSGYPEAYANKASYTSVISTALNNKDLAGVKSVLADHGFELSTVQLNETNAKAVMANANQVAKDQVMADNSTFTNKYRSRARLATAAINTGLFSNRTNALASNLVKAIANSSGLSEPVCRNIVNAQFVAHQPAYMEDVLALTDELMGKADEVIESLETTTEQLTPAYLPESTEAVELEVETHPLEAFATPPLKTQKANVAIAPKNSGTVSAIFLK